MTDKNNNNNNKDLHDDLSKILKDSPIHQELAKTIEAAAAIATTKVISKTIDVFREDARAHGHIVGFPADGAEVISAISISGLTLTRAIVDSIGHAIAMVNAACIIHGDGKGVNPADLDFNQLIKEAAKVVNKHDKENEEMNG